MTNRKLLWLFLGLCVAGTFLVLGTTDDKVIPNELAVVHASPELANVDWCKVCVEQKSLYYKFCTVKVTNGDIIIPDGITPSAFCETMAEYEIDICLAESCNK